MECVSYMDEQSCSSLWGRMLCYVNFLLVILFMHIAGSFFFLGGVGVGWFNTIR